jgi:mono/diheme cytochrome c family protein
MVARSLGLILGAACVLALACGKESEQKAAPAAPVKAAASSGPSQAAKDEAKEIFVARCALCHGVSGAANGPNSEELKPQPRNFQDPEWQASVTDAHIEKIIVEGGAAVGKSAVMPPNPDLVGKPDVVMALRAYVRRLKE